MCGLVKKAVVADYIAQYNNWIFDSPETYSGFENLMGVLGYTVQIYCDFSGYSDISIGLAALMGIHLKDNFRFPYQSTNLTEFWRRWHISLSTWFRDYVYIPLGGNRHSTLRTYFNNLLTMALAGLWHGSTLMFVFWGLIHGLGLVVHKSLKGVLDLVPNKWPVRFVCWFVTFCYVAAAWVYFRSPDVETCGDIFVKITTDFDLAYLLPFVEARPVWTAMVVGALLLCGLRESAYSRLQTRFVMLPWLVKLLLFAAVIQLVVEFHTNNVQPFIYYQF
jgi:D-alanyl-lipoteichoic acid acyltransferase DltB (MBOAT superfamily)